MMPSGDLDTMKVTVLYNPIAGAGAAAATARSLGEELTDGGHDTALLETRLEPTETWLDDCLVDSELLVVVGGDGAMRLVGESAARIDTPVYHFPMGTENLFARGFGMDRSVSRLLAAIDRFHVQQVDIGVANDRTFLLMASIGFDADVVHDLASRRAGGISHWTYVAPILRQLASWKPPRLTIRVDGDPAVQEQTGFAVVANSRQYGQRFDPARRASMTDGLLDVVFFPTSTRIGLCRWAFSTRLGRHMSDRRLTYRQGREVEMLCADPRRFQLDGDSPDPNGGEDAIVTKLRISLRPNALPVLTP